MATDVWLPTPPLATARLVLRDLTTADAPRIAALADDVRIARNLGPAFPVPYTLADAEAFLSTRPASLGVTLRDGEAQRLIGVIGEATAPAETPGVLRFGYWFGVDYWGKGYATEAVRRYVAAVEALPTRRRIEASVFSWNPASARVLEKAGFELEARLKDQVSIRGETCDELVFGRNF